MQNEQIEQEFFEEFGIEPVDYVAPPQDEFCGDRQAYLDDSLPIYPPITPEIVLGLEEILFKSVFNDGIHIHSPFDEEYSSNWSYQLTYYKGGYYICGYGNTRTHALLDQFITIIEDEDVENDEKKFIIEKVKALFKC